MISRTPGSGPFCSVAPLLRGVMNENAAPHLLFGPITSLQSLQRFQWHPNPAAARKRVGGKHSLLALLEQKKYAVAPNDGFRSKRRSRDVDVFVTRIPAQTPPPSFICPPRPWVRPGAPTITQRLLLVPNDQSQRRRLDKPRPPPMLSIVLKVDKSWLQTST